MWRPATGRAVFGGLAAYREAGGQIIADLFQADEEGYVADPISAQYPIELKITRQRSPATGPWRDTGSTPRLATSTHKEPLPG